MKSKNEAANWNIDIMNKALVILLLVMMAVGCVEKKSGQGIIADHHVPAPPGEAPQGMVWIPGGQFTMGTNDPKSYEHERPAHTVRVDGFWMDATEVTNRQFKAFTDTTGYVTIAERKPEWSELQKQLPPGTLRPHDSLLVAGSLVFSPPDYAVSLDDYLQWWKWTPGANWRHPQGPGIDLEGKWDHPSSTFPMRTLWLFLLCPPRGLSA